MKQTTDDVKIFPTREEAAAYGESGRYNLLPLWTELYADMVTPIEVLRRLKKVSSHVFLLESAEDNRHFGRYTFLGFEPKLEMVCQDGKVQVTQNGEKRTFHENPAKCVRELIRAYKSPCIEGLPSFSGGLAGYFSYDFIKYSERKS